MLKFTALAVGISLVFGSALAVELTEHEKSVIRLAKLRKQIADIDRTLARQEASDRAAENAEATRSYDAAADYYDWRFRMQDAGYDLGPRR